MRKIKSVLMVVMLAMIAVLAFFPETVMSQSQPASLIINYAESTQVQNEQVNEIRAYLSVLDADGKPIRNLKSSDMAVFLGSQSISDFQLTPSQDPIAIILVLDTSGSMKGTPLQSLKDAALQFIQTKGPQDEFAIIAFDQSVRNVTTGFISDTQLLNAVNSLIVPEQGGWTCLYDAVYSAAQLAVERPLGRRAIVVMSDGRDQGPPNGSTPCSTHTLSEAIDKATQGTIKAPIYTIGLGTGINKSEMEELARKTGGRSLIAPKSTDLAQAFQQISDLLRSQYLLQFRTPGAGTYSLRIKLASTGLADEKQVFLPAPPPPTPTPEGPAVELAEAPYFDQASYTIAFTLTLKPEKSNSPIKKVIWAIDGVPRATITKEPFNVWAYGTANMCPGLGDHEIKAEAYNEAGGKGEFSITVSVTKDMCQTSAPLGVVVPPSVNWALIGLIAVAATAALGTGLFALRRVSSPQVKKQVTTEVRRVISQEMGDKTEDGYVEEVGLVARVMLLDGAKTANNLTGKDMTKAIFSIGRGSGSDLQLKDTQVSREHAEIHYDRTTGQFTLFDLKSHNGTSVDNQRLPKGGNAVLHDGTQIQIGTTLIQFQVSAGEMADWADEKTEDSIVGEDE